MNCPVVPATATDYIVAASGGLYQAAADIVTIMEQMTSGHHAFLTSRQCGISTAMSAHALHEAIAHDGITVVFCQRHSRSALYCIRQLMQHYYRGLCDSMLIDNNSTSIRFVNNSRIIAVAPSASSFRGMTISRLYMDMDLYDDQHVQGYQAALPALQLGANRTAFLSFTATEPNSQTHRFWQSFNDSDKTIHVHEGMNSGLCKQFMIPEEYNREYKCMFV